MEKIIADLEDFEMPEEKVEPEKDEYTKECINDILFKLDAYCINNEKEKNNDFINIRTKFIQFFNKETRLAKTKIKKTDMITEYRKCLENKSLKQNILLEKLLCKKPSRSISGIVSITLVMTPYPHDQSFSCKHDCFYCPNEPAHKGNGFQAQPRSYLYHEPAVRRANQHQFDAFKQMIDRMNTLLANGHTIDKLEIIVEGGTYTEYPELYLEEFNRDTYYAANTYFDLVKREKKSLLEEVEENRLTKVHIIGICIETRPDAMNDNWIRHFRKCGVTRIQLGIQSTHDHILKKINRGHTIKQGLDAIEMLKDLAFKIDIHIMPDLPYSRPELDKEMMDYVYTVLQPDQIKLYPCAVVPWTKIEKWYNDGKWTPYTPVQLKEVMDYAMSTCPDWIRLPRVIRDIPNAYIQAGNKITNLRQQLVVSNDIRSREIERHTEYFNRPGKIFIEKYSAHDYFISYESHDKVALFGFIRLRLPKEKQEKNNNTLFKCLNGKALIRELHVYGFNTAVGEQSRASQHLGIGTKLLKKAESIAYWRGYPGIAVISGEGVKEYYFKKGYYDKETYMVKDFIPLKTWFNHLKNSVILMFLLILVFKIFSI
jgi:ELP3 family radical SAM enzyme/protein acetyltransferase